MPTRSSRGAPRDRGDDSLASEAGGSTSGSSDDGVSSDDMTSKLLQAIDALRGEIAGLKKEIRDCCTRDGSDASTPPTRYRGCSDEEVLIEIERLRRDILEWRERDERERQIWALGLQIERLRCDVKHCVETACRAEHCGGGASHTPAPPYPPYPYPP